MKKRADWILAKGHIKACRQALSSCSEFPNSSGHASADVPEGFSSLAEATLSGCKCVLYGKENRHWPCPIHASAAKQAVSVPDVTEFGNGEFVVSKGRYGEKPAVFVAPVQNGAGVVGESPGEREPDADPYFLPGEWAMTFPTDEQAKSVCEALWNNAAPTKADTWIKCSERLPEESDGDCDGTLWVYDKGLSKVEISDLEDVKLIRDYTHWMPTNLVRPELPKEQDDE